MRTDDLISVIVPAYNHVAYVEETVRSIMAQTYQNIELLVLDDGSKDDTFKVLKSLQSECEKRFARVVFETQENSGTRVTLNRLIDMAQGEYIYLIASDDLAKPEAIEKLHTFLADNPDYVLAVGDSEIIDTQSKRIYWDRNKNVVPQGAGAIKTGGESLEINAGMRLAERFGEYGELLKANHVPNGYLMRKTALLTVGKYNPKILLEDWYMNLQLSKVGKFKYMQEILFSYRWHSSNTMSNPDFLKKMRRIYKEIWGNEKEYACSNGYKKLWKELYEPKFTWKGRVLKKIKKIRDFFCRKVRYFIHSLSDVQSKKIGNGTKIWQFCVVLPNAKIGKNCNICSHCFIENDVVVGNNVTVKCGVQLWDGVTLEDDVFIGPNVTFCNDKHPKSGNKNFKLEPVIVKKGASIGANATILPGITIGENAVIAAGAVVIKDVPANIVYYGERV